MAILGALWAKIAPYFTAIMVEKAWSAIMKWWSAKDRKIAALVKEIAIVEDKMLASTDAAERLALRAEMEQLQFNLDILLATD